MHRPLNDQASQREKTGGTLSKEEFESLFVDSYSSLVLVAASQVGMSMAEDVVQEAAIKASSRLDRFERGTDFKSWLAAFVRNAGRNARRKEQRHTRMKEDLAHEQRSRQTGQAQAEVFAEHDNAIRDAVGDLPDVQRSALLMRATLDQSYAEIGQMLGIPETTARSHVHRARARVLRAVTTKEQATTDAR